MIVRTRCNNVSVLFDTIYPQQKILTGGHKSPGVGLLKHGGPMCKYILLEIFTLPFEVKRVKTTNFTIVVKIPFGRPGNNYSRLLAQPPPKHVCCSLDGL
jgi:hypothetical protein